MIDKLVIAEDDRTVCIGEDEFIPYRKLAIEVIASAFRDIMGRAVHINNAKVRGNNIKISHNFLTARPPLFYFWCDVAGLDPDFVHNIYLNIKEKYVY